MKKILPVVAGVIAGGITVFIVESIGHLIWPPPEGIDITDPEGLAQLMDVIPIGALVFVVIAWIAGAIAGGFVAGKMAKDPSYLPGIITGAVLMVFGVMTMVSVPHPIWMWIFGIVAPVPSAWYGSKLAGTAPSE